ncbi:hypothetical protein [Clostridium oryzae]|uniref:Uncharacterized protein n=1 Tax=Clostridium oryzae TaxID=1450648 RepID=A0A1V4IL61_9CLOT|nr:hypothetical protein [Clostridium oryzae]OPJ60666.1 hypothetical protein CLORY_27170 [Clostridium oryzae]
MELLRDKCVLEMIEDLKKQLRTRGIEDKANPRFIFVCGEQIDVEAYYKFLNELNATKRSYKIELVHTSRLVYPKGTDDFQVKYVEHGRKEILSSIFKNQKYYMRYGDDFSIRLTEQQEEPSRLLQSSMYFINSSYNKYLSFKYGGMVENESV